MRIAVTVCFVLTSLSVAFGQDRPAPTPRIVGGAYHPHPPIPRPSVPYASRQPKRSEPVPATAFGATDRLEHLLQAAVHLEVAGELDQARQVRRLVAQERHSLLSRLDKQNADAGPRQVKVQFLAMEISLTRLKELGLEWKRASITGDEMVGPAVRSPHFGNPIYDDGTALLHEVDTLREKGAVRILAEPTVIATSGRPATFQSSGRITREQADGSERLVDVGTRIDLVPEVTQPGRVHLKFKIAITEPCPGLSQPRVRRVDAPRMEMKSGQTHVIAGLLQHSKDRNETVELVILVTPEVVDASLTAHVAPEAGAAK